MALKYEPKPVRGGSSVLPYGFVPPVDGVIATKSFSFSGSVVPRITKTVAVMVVAFYTVVSVLLAGSSDNLGYLLLYAALGMLFSVMALRGTIPTLMIATLAGVPFMFSNTYGFAPVTLLLFLLFCIVVGFKKRFSRGSVARSINRNAENLADLKESMIPVWGVPGGHIAANTGFGDAAKIGAKGEVIVGNELEKLVRKFPHVRVFHGVCFTPGKQGADIDHVVAIGDDVFLIDAKMWAYGHYSWGRNGEVLRDGSRFNGGDVHMNAALEKWQAYLGRSARRISSIVCMVNTGSGKFSFPDSLSGGVRLTTINQLVAILTETARKSAPVVDRGVVYSVASQLQ